MGNNGQQWATIRGSTCISDAVLFLSENIPLSASLNVAINNVGSFCNAIIMLPLIIRTLFGQLTELENSAAREFLSDPGVYLGSIVPLAMFIFQFVLPIFQL